MNAPSKEFPSYADRQLLPALLDDATRMNFFRFCELIELAAPDKPPLGASDSPATEPVRFRSRARIGFPNREIDAVEYDLDNPSAPPAVRTTFLGLYGVDARMPSYFVEEVAQNRDGADPMSSFLDLSLTGSLRSTTACGESIVTRPASGAGAPTRFRAIC